MKASLARAIVAVLAVAFVTQTVHAVQNANIIAHWRFDEEFGTVAEDVAPSDTVDNPGNYEDAANSSPSWGAGTIGGGVTLTGAADSFFRTNDLTELDGATAITISAWVRSNGLQTDYRGIAMSRGTEDNTGPSPMGMNSWGIGRDGGGNFDIRSSTGGVDVFRNGNEVPSVGEWVHVAMTWDGTAGVGGTLGQTKAYVDGVLEGMSDNEPATSIVTFGELFLGNDDCCGNREVNATLDDVGIWNIALSDADIAQIHTQGLNNIDLQDVAAPVILPGDVDRSGFVTILDYNIIRDNFGQPIPGNTSARGFGDLSGNNEVDLDDFAEWKANYTGAVDPPPVSASTAVPEPTGLALALLGLGCLSLRLTRGKA